MDMEICTLEKVMHKAGKINLRNTGIFFIKKALFLRRDKVEFFCLLQGTYYLRDYSFEDELKNLTSLMTFGHYNLTVSILADIEGKEAKIASGSVLMWSKDEKKKKYEQKLKKWPKCNKYD